MDTPGQIEVFTWSASGAIITETLAASYATVVVYVVDTPRCTSPATFMSNMLYACSILYKTKLPFVLLFNKTDVVSHDFATAWMQDSDAFREALSEESSMMASLVRSMALVLQEFYEHLRCVGVSAITGDGMDDFFRAVDEAAKEHQDVYVPELERRRMEKQRMEARKRERQLRRFKDDLQAGNLNRGATEPRHSDDEDQDDGDDEGSGGAMNEFESPYVGVDDEDDDNFPGGRSGDYEPAEEARRTRERQQQQRPQRHHRSRDDDDEEGEEDEEDDDDDDEEDDVPQTEAFQMLRGRAT